VSRLKVIVLALLARLFQRRRDAGEPDEEPERIVPPTAPDRGAETAVLMLLVGTAVCAGGFVAIFVIEPAGATQWEGVTLGAAFALLAAALIVLGLRLVPDEEDEEDYPPEHEADQEAIVRTVRESGSGITRKRLLLTAGAGAGGALGAALVAPVVSLGPVFDTGELYASPWRRGRRLVDSDAKPLSAAGIEQGTFYTAFPEGADKEQIAAPLVVVRVDPDDLDLPPGREGWAPGGIVAFSKICTHAGCAVSLYRAPHFEPAQPHAALVCPCHYSTFDPARGAKVEFGPAGRSLPQLPLLVDGDGVLRAGGDFSGPVGPGWWGVRKRGQR
jgi:quinol---cytochrome c reductase iron-sulfur subunit